MKRNPWLIVLSVFIVLIFLVVVAFMAAMYTAFGEHMPAVASNSVMVLEVKGIIVDSKKFLKSIEKYGEDPDVKAIVIRLDSPGGVVGASQEIYDEILRVRKKGKHVVASLANVAASGAYYIAVACEKIVTNPGTITGSIGVIMEFANLSRLYNWAKVERYVVKSGKFKDTGSEYRPMEPHERELIQTMIDNVLGQFKKAVSLGRKIPMEKLSQLADGRIFTGEQAVRAGLADELGGIQEAIDIAAKLGGIKGEPEIFYAPPPKRRLLDLVTGSDDLEESVSKLTQMLRIDLMGQPLYLMPGTHP